MSVPKTRFADIDGIDPRMAKVLERRSMEFAFPVQAAVILSPCSRSFVTVNSSPVDGSWKETTTGIPSMPELPCRGSRTCSIRPMTLTARCAFVIPVSDRAYPTDAVQNVDRWMPWAGLDPKQGSRLGCEVLKLHRLGQVIVGPGPECPLDVVVRTKGGNH